MPARRAAKSAKAMPQPAPGSQVLVGVVTLLSTGASVRVSELVGADRYVLRSRIRTLVPARTSMTLPAACSSRVIVRAGTEADAPGTGVDAVPETPGVNRSRDAGRRAICYLNAGSEAQRRSGVSAAARDAGFALRDGRGDVRAVLNSRAGDAC